MSSIPIPRLGFVLTILLLISSSIPINAAALPRPMDSPSQVQKQPLLIPTPTSLPTVPFHQRIQSVIDQQSKDSLNHNLSPNDLYDFYKPWQVKAESIPEQDKPERIIKFQNVYFDTPPTKNKRVDNHVQISTPVDKRDDIPTVPTSYLAEPTFPAEYPSCPKCQEKYDSISNCAKASAVFQNATSIFNDPFSYIAVIKCACTDTFQAVYPQCVDCFQHTDQCWFLGTDPQGTGAPSIITNIRQICGFGSALLGGVASANSANNSYYIPTNPGSYYDVTQTGVGYKDGSTGALFGSPASPSFQLKSNHALIFFTVSSILVAGMQTLF